MIQLNKRLKCNDKSILIIESALILETELKKLIDKLIVVKCSRHQQLARFKNKQLSVIEGKQRLKMQLPLSKKIEMADFVINNSKDIKNLNEQVNKIWDKLINENSSNNSICGTKPADGRKD
ncbi:dephospho-CoA kinase [Candidatus Poribacteria bacterium]|nr:dephospho-CoA kinase [Candidatus Poribacteria bacterium]